MSGPLSTLTDTIARLTRSRGEARVRAQVKRLREGVVFTGLSHQPEVRAFGDFAAARGILKGTLRVGGYAAPLHDLTPWDLDLPTEAVTARLHRFEWLDDMEALSGKSARARAQGWTLGWLDRYGDGSGPGWTAAVTADRLRRMITHLPFLEKHLSDEALARIQTSLPPQLAFVAETWTDEGDTASRVTALTGMIYGAVCLTGAAAQLAPAVHALAATVSERVNAQGAIASRNPEALLSIFRNLLDVKSLLADASHVSRPEIDGALHRIAPVLRGLRHGDGSLAAFHGGSPGAEGLLDRSLAESRIRTRPDGQPAMGFARLHGGRVQVIVDCARPPERSDSGHASTLAFEASSGRRPIIVNCGPGLPHLPEVSRSARTTAAHSTLSLDKTSSSRLGPARAAGKPGFDALQTRPSMVTLAQAQDTTGMWIQTRHDGYLEDYGLLHERRIFVGAQGHQVHGEDVLLSPDDKSRRRFLARIKGASKLGVFLSLHFHLHPDVTAELQREIDTVRLTLKSGEIWLFRHKGGQMDLENSVYLDPSAPEPIPTRQIDITYRATEAKAEISWSLVRESVTSRSRRDVAIDDRQT